MAKRLTKIFCSRQKGKENQDVSGSMENWHKGWLFLVVATEFPLAIYT